MVDKMKKITLPHLGNRIIKTAVAVLICLVAHILVGYRGSASNAAVAAIICMQPYVTDSRTFAVERVVGTLIGSAWGLLYLLIMPRIPVEENMFFAYLMMAVFVLLAMYSTVLLKMVSTAGLVAIIFISAVVEYPSIEITPAVAAGNVLDTLFGVIVAVIVNVSRFPRKKHPEKLFFVRTMDLSPDRYTQIASSVHIALDYLYRDGAKICLISRWAPAFILSQMGTLNVNAPVIVMDGAAMYDVSENKYLDVIEIPRENADRLSSIITGFGSFCSYYAIHDRTLCIYRSGPLSDAEREEYEKLKRSPYRNYMDGPCHEDDRIAFMRVIDTPERIEELEYLIKSVLPPGMFRMEIRQEAQFREFRGLYFYNPVATVAEMKSRVIAYLEKKESMQFEPVDMLPRLSRYVPEKDALALLGRLKNEYEPVSLAALLPEKPEGH